MRGRHSVWVFWRMHNGKVKWYLLLVLRVVSSPSATAAPVRNHRILSYNRYAWKRLTRSPSPTVNPSPPCPRKTSMGKE